MKRSSSIAALDDSIDIKIESDRSGYDGNVLVSSMMLVSIEEANRRGNQSLRKHRSNGSMSSSSVTSGFSRCSSRGSLRGWGSTTSRKSYKVDLCSLAMDDFHEDTNNQHVLPLKDRRKCQPLTLQKMGSSSNSTSVSNAVMDSWGFFTE